VHPLRDRAIELRVNQRLSRKEIHEALEGAVVKTTIGRWLRDYQLTVEEKREKMIFGCAARETERPPAEATGGDSSAHYLVAVDRDLSTVQLGRIGESAVAFRAAIRGLALFKPTTDGSPEDYVIGLSDGRLSRLQVKMCKRGAVGAPTISLTDGRMRRYKHGTFDFIAGYDLYSDAVYIFTAEEVKGLRASVSVTASAKEAWHKLEPDDTE